MRWGYVISNLITILMSCRKLSRAAVHISFICWHPPQPPPKRRQPHPKKRKTPRKQKTTTKSYSHPTPPKLRISTGRQANISVTRMFLSVCLLHEADGRLGGDADLSHEWHVPPGYFLLMADTWSQRNLYRDLSTPPSICVGAMLACSSGNIFSIGCRIESRQSC